jgi:hypothetical protein
LNAFALLVNKNKTDLGFRAIRRALWDLRQHLYGVLTDTNSSVADLVPLKEHDKSVSMKEIMKKCFSYIEI